jgi:hypothetical protein
MGVVVIEQEAHAQGSPLRERRCALSARFAELDRLGCGAHGMPAWHIRFQPRIRQLRGV